MGFFGIYKGFFVDDWCGILPMSALAGYGWAVFTPVGCCVEVDWRLCVALVIRVA